MAEPAKKPFHYLHQINHSATITALMIFVSAAHKNWSSDFVGRVDQGLKPLKKKSSLNLKPVIIMLCI